jgi:hypothetical protein
MATKNFPQSRKARKESAIQNLTHLHRVLRYKDSSITGLAGIGRQEGDTLSALKFRNDQATREYQCLAGSQLI